jgi:hypothetical protein
MDRDRKPATDGSCKDQRKSEKKMRTYPGEHQPTAKRVGFMRGQP